MVADNALTVFYQAENALRAGKFDDALRAYLRVLRGNPKSWRTRFRMADTLLNLRARDEALGLYKALAWQAIKAGQPLSGLVALKMAALLDANQRESMDIVAQLYSSASDRVDFSRESLPHHILRREDPVGDVTGLEGPMLVMTAAAEATDTSVMGEGPERLPAIPLFSFLDEDAFIAILGHLQLKRFVKGQVLVQEGSMGDAFYVLAEGHVEVSKMQQGKRHVVARLHDGAVFGEMALISRAPRAATVTAVEDCEVLELKRAALEQRGGYQGEQQGDHQGERLASVTEALRQFTRERLLVNLTGTSALFKGFPRGVRAEIVKRFREYPAAAGDEVIAEGEIGEGLFLIMKGEVEVSKKDPTGERVRLASLREGDVFGEMSLLTESPTTATVRVTEPGEFLFLPKHEFADITSEHPELRAELNRLTAARLKDMQEKLESAQFSEVSEDDLVDVVEDDDLILL